MSVPDNSCFYFLRHGQTAPNRQGLRCGGDIDVPLDDQGQQQAEAAGRVLADLHEPLFWIAASPLLRVSQTVAAVRQLIGEVPVIEDERLRERRLGAWNGQSIAATEAALRAGETPPGGEAGDEFRARVLDWLHDWQPQFERPGLIVASKGISRVLAEELVGELRLLGNGELLRIRAAGGEVAIDSLTAGAGDRKAYESAAIPMAGNLTFR